MNEPTVICPNCHNEIKLTESLAAPLIEATRIRYEKIMSTKETDLASREAIVRSDQADIEKQKSSLDDQINARIKLERETIAVEEGKRAKLIAATDLEQKSKEILTLQEVLAERDNKLAEAQKAQIELIRKQREFDDARREMDLTIEKKVQDSLIAVRDQAKREAEDGLKFKVLEKEEQLAAMQRQIEELRRRAEQGSQQLQGEVQELELESLLQTKFPRDLIEPVPKGEFGGDVLHRVIGPQNQACGTILWESKRTKNCRNYAKINERQKLKLRFWFRAPFQEACSPLT
jgi:hypothetical protein